MSRNMKQSEHPVNINVPGSEKAGLVEAEPKMNNGVMSQCNQLYGPCHDLRTHALYLGVVIVAIEKAIENPDGDAIDDGVETEAENVRCASVE